LDDASAELIETAYHEAGHAVMGCICGRVPLSVDLRRDGDGNAGHTHFDKDLPACARSYFDQSDEKRRYIETRVLIGVAGTAAHDLYRPGRAHDEGDLRDDVHQSKIIEETVSWCEQAQYLEERKSDARRMLVEHWSWVAAVASHLTRKTEITGDEMLGIVNSTAVAAYPAL
jgi:hypothetical protein